MNALLVTGDLMVVSRVQGAATQNGVKVHASSTVEQALEQLAKEPAEVLIIDLATQSLDVQELVDRARAVSGRSQIIAFGPHVHEARLNAARQAGCDEVVSRGEFLMQLDAILQRYRAD